MSPDFYNSVLVHMYYHNHIGLRLMSILCNGLLQIYSYQHIYQVFPYYLKYMLY